MSRAAAIIVAAGSGLRAGGGIAKQYREIGGRPVLAWSAEVFSRHPRIGQVVVVHPPDDCGAARTALQGLKPDLLSKVVWVAGGATRSGSVQAGLGTVDAARFAQVLIHDAARPGVTGADIDALLAVLDSGAPAAAPVLPVADALWRGDDGSMADSVDRAGLWRVQTPQAFDILALSDSYAALPAGAALADDIAVARAAGLRAAPVPGSARLDKVTFPEDFARMSSLIAPPSVPRTGFGVDAHCFAPGDHVTLCGVRIGHAMGLAGHSDADVAWHALADAIYGALAEGDIGAWFPPSDPQWKGAASEVFLAHAAGRVGARGGRLIHVDVTLICEAPRVGPHRDAMRAETARVLGLPLDGVSVKATTTERMGFTGRGEGIAAQAVASVLLPDSAAP